MPNSFLLSAQLLPRPDADASVSCVHLADSAFTRPGSRAGNCLTPSQHWQHPGDWDRLLSTPTTLERTLPMSRRLFLAFAALLALALPVSAADKAIKVLIITGDHGHAWQETTPYLKEMLAKAGMDV